MKVYIDFDDVICETGRYFTILAKRLFGIVLPYRQVQFFNLKKSFDLNDEQYEEMMREAHTEESLLAYEETKDASKVINKWIDDGHEVSIVTGRPFEAYEASRKWLDNHGLSRVPLICVDKYGREKFNQNCEYNMTLDELYSKEFDFAIEDSPAAFEHVLHFDNCKVAVFDRPWNKDEVLPDNFVRCYSWDDVNNVFEKSGY